MEFTPITDSEFRAKEKRKNWNGKGNTFAQAIFNLEVDTGFSVPCTWQHRRVYGKGRIKKDGTAGLRPSSVVCNGTFDAHRVMASKVNAKGEKRRLRTTCQEGTLYVFRIE